VIENKEDGKQI